MDRHEAAVSRAATLEGRLSLIRIDVPDDVASLPGVELRRNGLLVDRALWSMELPFDPGEYAFEARAEGKEPWVTTITLGTDADRKRVRVPMLVDSEAVAPTEPALPFVSPTPPVRDEPAVGETNSDPYRTTAYVLGGAGVVAIGLGSYFGLQAMRKGNDSDEHCDGNRCKPEGITLRNEAIDAASLSNIGFGVGGALIVSAVLSYSISGGGSAETGKVRLIPLANASTLGWTAGGSF